MTRLELLKIVVGQARANGFDFRHWYTKVLGVGWTNAGDAFSLLADQRRYYSLLFSHQFASAFWKAGTNITFQVEQQTFQRVLPDGKVMTVTRKPFTRRSARRDAWRYHLREMALAEDPLRYIRKYVRVEGELEETGAARIKNPSVSKQAPSHGRQNSGKAASQAAGAGQRTSRPLPAGLPRFLQRPYP